MTKQERIRKLFNENPKVDRKAFREAMEILRALRAIPHRKRRRYELDSPFYPGNRRKSSDDPRAVYF
jgi:hypothetical protein